MAEYGRSRKTKILPYKHAIAAHGAAIARIAYGGGIEKHCIIALLQQET